MSRFATLKRADGGWGHRAFLIRKIGDLKGSVLEWYFSGVISEGTDHGGPGPSGHTEVHAPHSEFRKNAGASNVSERLLLLRIL